jgi:hypothetical protein
MGERGIGPLHVAAFWSNRTAIRIIQEHVDEYYPDEEMPYNTTNDGGSTALDASAEAAKKNKINEEENEQLDAHVLAVHREHAIKCYQMLRENGALHWFELKGVLIMYVSLFQVLWVPNMQAT